MQEVEVIAIRNSSEIKLIRIMLLEPVLDSIGFVLGLLQELVKSFSELLLMPFPSFLLLKHFVFFQWTVVFFVVETVVRVLKLKVCFSVDGVVVLVEERWGLLDFLVLADVRNP